MHSIALPKARGAVAFATIGLGHSTHTQFLRHERFTQILKNPETFFLDSRVTLRVTLPHAGRPSRSFTSSVVEDSLLAARVEKKGEEEDKVPGGGGGSW